MICDTLEHGHHNQNNRVNRNSSETMHDLICVVAHTPTHSWLVLSLEAVVEVRSRCEYQELKYVLCCLLWIKLIEDVTERTP